MVIGSFRQLRVYERAVELRRRVFELSKAWPREERYALTDQVRRSSRAIGANLAEAWSKRRYERRFVNKLTDAHGESEETGVWLDVAEECGYLSADQHEALGRLCSEASGGLVKMIREPEKWCGPSGLIREESTSYYPEP